MIDLTKTGWIIWAGRTAFTLVATAGIAFGVADYVVKARTASLDTAIGTVSDSVKTGLESNRVSLETSLAALNSSINTLQSVTLGIDTKVDTMVGKLGGLQTTIAVNSERIARLQVDIERAQAALVDTSLNVQTTLEGALDYKLQAATETITANFERPRMIKTIQAAEFWDLFTASMKGEGVWDPTIFDDEGLIQLNMPLDAANEMERQHFPLQTPGSERGQTVPASD